MTNKKNERQAQPKNEQGIVRKSATMTSLEIAKTTGKRHKHVLESIRSMEPAWEKVTGTNFRPSEYKDPTGRKLPVYELSKIECLYISTKFNDEARAKLIIRWEELEMQNLSKQKQLSQTASPYQERTLISVRLGSEMTQIWIEGGIVYAPLARLMRYAGRESGLTPKVREQVGEDHFLKVLVNDKQEHWFVSLAGFTEVAKRISISAADYHNILIMYGDREPDPLPEWAYCFTEGEMLDIIKVVNRRPINKSDIIESLLNGKKR